MNVCCEKITETDSSGSTRSLMPYQRYGHTVVAYEGKAYLWGGRNDEHGASAQMHVFDPGLFFSALKKFFLLTHLLF